MADDDSKSAATPAPPSAPEHRSKSSTWRLPDGIEDYLATGTEIKVAVKDLTTAKRLQMLEQADSSTDMSVE